MPERTSYDYPLAKTHPSFSTAFDAHLDPNVETNNICWIIHSSGSTGLPKPIKQTHAAALRNYSNNFSMNGFITLPLFHAHGISSVFRAIHSGRQIHVYNADLPLTSPYLVESMERHPPEIFYGVPYALKLLAESREGMEALKKCRLVMFGGSSCPDVLGDRLVKNGVKLVSHYGTTETGQLMTSFREDGDYDWNYLKVSPNLKPFVRWDQQAGDVYELVILDGWASKVATNRPDGSYATKDLFLKHPTKEDRWKYFGRLDDTLVLVNGEKANPIQTEHTVRENPYVSEAVVFGAGKQQLGSIVILSDNSRGMLEQEVMERVWPSFETANTLAPEYARISQEMVRFLPPGTPFPRTDKGTVIRAAFYNIFKSDIEEIYADIERGAVNGGLELPETEIKDFVRNTVLSLLRLPDPLILRDDTDFFSIGMDSLMAARIRSAILKNLNTGGQTLGLNIVFEKPSVNQLSKFLFRLRVPEKSGVEEEETVEETMKRLIEKYSEFPMHIPGDSDVEGEHVVVTGATGSLGAHIVAQLVAMKSVKSVFCLVRAESPRAAWDRTVQSLQVRRVYDNLSDEEKKKMICLPSNLAEEDLGLGQGRYEELKCKVTAIIHSAWSVNFNMDVTSFEAQHIRGTHNLIKLCLRSNRPSPAGFNFLSSVSSVAATVGSQVPESVETYLQSAQPMGYARSKLITENICNLAAKKARMSSRVHRVGQVVGDTDNGIWNATEAIPLLIQGALSTGALPALEDTPTWLPVNIVAKVVLELAFVPSADAPLNALFHVVNPNTIHWTNDLLPALKEAGLEFDIVGKRDWVDKLRKSDPDPVKNPTFKLVDFFAKKYDNDRVGKGLYYRTELARALSPTLRDIGVVDTKLVSKFVDYWRKNCWNV
ncbi:uncharacterized protein H6S33_008377 [Morchella sextelata]|uniref:uncharacterized protein n=1 Tax=Morchella sextelata TaxID=1174677 RepID=UPI001D051BED|nr:uncharacterized protein H6S33_008377 [Morchella sextelata]KAH0602727.1 hypothetical protein H6S33_008377 [Morchella sextelata]